ncbi:MAG: DUF2490 domain-containing protein [Sandaracinaceae bacterium]
MRAWITSGLLALSVVSGVASARAQDRDDFQIWAANLGTASLSREAPSFVFWWDVHARRGDAGTVLLVRPGLGVKITPWLSVHGGYAWVPVFSDAMGTAVHEHRIWEQAVLSHSFDFGLSLQSRTRFEQRFSEAGSDVGLRLRQFVRANWQPDPDVPIGVAFWDEIFVALTTSDWGQVGGMDQNRVFLGPFLKMAPWARLEAGYLFVYLDRGTTDLYAHVLAVNLFVSWAPPAPPAPEL